MNRKEIDFDRVYESKYGAYKILSVFKRGRRQMCLIEFVKTKFRTEVRRESALHGNVRDLYFPSCCGVGYMGEVSMKENKRLYDIWRTMISRCYNPNNCEYHNYGRKGVVVCERWHCYKNFLDDAKLLNGYELFLKNKNPKGVHLEKDILRKERKIYSPETCCWTTAEANERARWKKDIELKNQSSKHMGVSMKGIGKYSVRFSNNGERINIGTFSDENAAANAYNYYARLYETSHLNDCEFMSKEEWESFRTKRGGKRTVSRPSTM